MPGVVPIGVASVVVRNSGPGRVTVTQDSGGGVSIMTVPGLVPSGGIEWVVGVGPSVVYVVHDGVSTTTVPGVVPTGVASVVVRKSGPGRVSVTQDPGGGVSIITVPGLVPSGGFVIVVGVGPSVVYVVQDSAGGVSMMTVPGVVPSGGIV